MRCTRQLLVEVKHTNRGLSRIFAIKFLACNQTLLVMPIANGWRFTIKIFSFIEIVFHTDNLYSLLLFVDHAIGVSLIFSCMLCQFRV